MIARGCCGGGSGIALTWYVAVRCNQPTLTLYVPGSHEVGAGVGNSVGLGVVGATVTVGETVVGEGVMQS